jgi:Protein kinase domain
MKPDDRQNPMFDSPTGSFSAPLGQNREDVIGKLFRQSAPEISERYTLLRLAGQGGMGIVYCAHDRETDEQIAIKMLRPEVVSDETVFERFRNELRLSRRITHKNVCRIYEFNRSGNLAFITMEFVEGESLREVLYRRGKISVTEGLPWAMQLCSGVGEAHAQGVVHRDLKPENVMLERSGTLKIMDFGLARSLEGMGTLSGQFMGTPAYMAPEQAEGKAIDDRVDVYALGLILFEMFTGVPTFQADTPVSLALKQVRERPKSPRELEPSISTRLAEIILKCLEKDPQHRYQSVEELKAALAREGEITQRAQRTPQHRSSPLVTPASALPLVPRWRTRTLLTMIEIMYLTFYFVALAKMDNVMKVVGPIWPSLTDFVLGTVLLTGLLGIAVRLYLLCAVIFDYVGLGESFRLIFLPLLALDTVWAFCPLLVAHKIGVGLALAVSVGLLYLPFSQRMLIRIGYGS